MRNFRLDCSRMMAATTWLACLGISAEAVGAVILSAYAAVSTWGTTGAQPSRLGSTVAEVFQADTDDDAQEAALDFEVRAFEGMIETDVAVARAVSAEPSDALGSCTAAKDSVAKIACLRESLEDLRVRRIKQEVSENARPSVPPLYGLVTSSFGERQSPFAKKKKVFHAGIDIAAPVHSLFVAPADGLVIAVERKTGYGAILTIDHGGGVETKYAHVGTIVVAEGRHVKRGDALGMVGLTGKTTGPHLHYEIWVDGKPSDPLAYMSLPTVSDIKKMMAVASAK